MSETNTILCHGIDSRSLDVGIPHVRKLIVGKFVRHDVDDVGRSAMSRGAKSDAKDQREEEGTHTLL